MYNVEGSKKAAVLLMLLGRDKAEQILQRFDEQEIAKISRAMPLVGSLSKSEAVIVMTDYLTRVEELAIPGAGMVFGSSLLENHNRKGIQVDALDMLAKLPAEKVAEILEHEHEQVIAVILAYFDAEHASDCLMQFPTELRNELVLRIAALNNLQPQLLEEINQSLDTVVSDATNNSVAFSGAEKMADIIMNMPREVETQVMSSLEESPDIITRVRKYFLSFEQCAQFTAREMLLILKDFDREQLALACSKEDESLINGFANSMSSRAQAAFREELTMIEAEASSDKIEAARRELINHVKRLINAGDISNPSKQL